MPEIISLLSCMQIFFVLLKNTRCLAVHKKVGGGSCCCIITWRFLLHPTKCFLNKNICFKNNALTFFHMYSVTISRHTMSTVHTQQKTCATPLPAIKVVTLLVFWGNFEINSIYPCPIYATFVLKCSKWHRKAARTTTTALGFPLSPTQLPFRCETCCHFPPFLKDWTTVLQWW